MRIRRQPKTESKAEPVEATPEPFETEPERDPENERRAELSNRQLEERRARLSADPAFLIKERIAWLENKIEERRENLKHAGPPTTARYRSAERNIEKLEAELDELWPIGYPAVEEPAHYAAEVRDPNGPLFEPFRCSNYECDGLIRDAGEKLQQLGMCAVCYLEYRNPTPKPNRRRFNV